MARVISDQDRAKLLSTLLRGDGGNDEFDADPRVTVFPDDSRSMRQKERDDMNRANSPMQRPRPVMPKGPPPLPDDQQDEDEDDNTGTRTVQVPVPLAHAGMAALMQQASGNSVARSLGADGGGRNMPEPGDAEYDQDDRELMLRQMENDMPPDEDEQADKRRIRKERSRA